MYAHELSQRVQRNDQYRGLRNQDLGEKCTANHRQLEKSHGKFDLQAGRQILRF